VGLIRLHPDDPHGQVGILFAMIGDHMLVIHLVDVIAGQDENLLRFIILDEIDISVDRIGGTAVPVRLVRADIGGKDRDAAVAAKHVPGRPGADMVDQ